MEKKYIITAALFVLSFLSAWNSATAQQYTSEPRTVYVGYQMGKFAPDSAGVLAAVAKAKALQESLGGFVTVDIAPGCATDLGDSCIVMPDSVLFNCGLGSVISSDNNTATFTDDSVTVYSKIVGEPTIINTNALSKRIVLKDSSSVIDGFYWEYSALINADNSVAGNNPGVYTLHNNTGVNFTWTYPTTGEFIGTPDVSIGNIFCDVYSNSNYSNNTTRMIEYIADGDYSYPATAFYAVYKSIESGTLKMQIYDGVSTYGLVASTIKTTFTLRMYPTQPIKISD